MNQDLRNEFGKASTFLKSGKKAEALAVLKPILAEQPDNAEAWWLVAHAAPTPDATVFACQKVLALKPDHAPARKALTDTQLKQAENLLKEMQTAEAVTLLKPILAAQPDNIEALWLMARAVPTSAEAIVLCQKILELNPDHEQARRMIASRQQILAVADARKREKAQKQAPRSRPWMVFLLVGLIGIMAGGFLVARTITGRSFGVQLDPKQTRASLGEVRPDTAPPAQMDVLPVDGLREYEFDAQDNSLFMAMVLFPAVNGNPGKAVRLLNASGKVIATGENSGMSANKMAIVQATLSEGHYVLQLRGMAGIAEGAFNVQMRVESMPD
jgi:tetratricopeptide (TPR) repeat protein